MGALTVKEVLEKRIILRDKRSELKKVFTEHDNKLKDAEQQCETWLLGRAEETGVDNFKVNGVGTAFKSITTRVSGSDWNAIHKWVKETGNLNLFERRVSKTFVQDYRKEHGGMPPGISVFEEVVMNVRRSNSPKEEV